MLLDAMLNMKLTSEILQLAGSIIGSVVAISTTMFGIFKAFIKMFTAKIKEEMLSLVKAIDDLSKSLEQINYKIENFEEKHDKIISDIAEIKNSDLNTNIRLNNLTNSFEKLDDKVNGHETQIAVINSKVKKQ
jgi:uncharacterized coiled-coil DUF342 family protein